MKKLLKSEIYGFVNSTQCALFGPKKFEKSNFTQKRMKKKKKKNKQTNKTQTQTQSI